MVQKKKGLSTGKIVALILSITLVPLSILFVLFCIIKSSIYVEGNSMAPTLNNKDMVILNRFDKSYDRFDIIAIKYKNSILIKRIIGLPKENIEYKNNILYVDGKIIEDIVDKTQSFSLRNLYNVEKIPDKYYFVMGDNRDISLDSRDYSFGLIKESDIIGVISFRIYPFSKFGKIK